MENKSLTADELGVALHLLRFHKVYFFTGVILPLDFFQLETSRKFSSTQNRHRLGDKYYISHYCREATFRHH